jgi:chromosome segregation ATPase
VSEQDYAGTLRHVMFEQLTQIAQRLPPEVALRMLTMAMEFSDLPNKDEVAEQIRKITGDRDPSKEPTPEEQQQIEQQQQMQAEALQMQREQAITALEEQKAKVAKLQAEAAEIMGRAQSNEADDVQPAANRFEIEQAVNQVRQQAQAQIDSLSDQLRKVQAEASNRTMQIEREADTALEIARIDADTKSNVAQIAHDSSQRIEALQLRLQALTEELNESRKAALSQGKPETLTPVKQAEPVQEAKAEPKKPSKKIVKVIRDESNKIVGAEVEEQEQ